MLSNLRNGLKFCRQCTKTSTRLLLTTVNSNLEASTISTRSSRSFSIDVASLIGEPSIQPERPSVGRKIQSRIVQKPTISEIPHWVKTPVDLAILKAQNSSDLWSVAAKYQLMDSQAVSFLAALAKFAANEKDVEFSSILSSPMKLAFDAVIRVLLESAGLPIGDAVLTLRSLLALEVPAENELVVQLRNKILKDHYLIPQPALVSFAVFHSKFAGSSELAKQLQTQIEESLFKRPKEISDSNDVLNVFKLLKRPDSSKYKIIEAKLIELIPSFTGSQVVRLLNILALKHARSLPLLRAAANRYAQSDDDLPITKLAELLSDLVILNYPNQKIISVLFRDIEAKVQTITKPALAVGIFSSLAIMRLRCKEFLEALCQWTRQHLDTFTPEECVSVLMALARCNYVPTTVEGHRPDLIAEILKKLFSKKFVAQKPLCLDAIWALAILGRLSKEHAACVLEKSFYGELLKSLSDNDYKLLVAQLKLRNINTAARLEVDGYKGPFLDATSFKEVTNVNVVQYKDETVKLLTDALNNLAPRDKYMKTNVMSPEGYMIDALLRVTSDGKPLRINQWDKSGSDSWPVAVIVRHFNDTTQISESPIGVHAMAARHLNALRYIVLEIPAAELEQRRQPLARVQLLKEKLAAAVQSTGTSHSS